MEICEKLSDDFYNSMISPNKFNDIWNSIFLQLSITLYILDDIFHGFYPRVTKR
jgi:hypothetical protein